MTMLHERNRDMIIRVRRRPACYGRRFGLDSDLARRLRTRAPGCRPAGTTAAAAAVRPGVEVFLEKHLDLIKGKRVGLITNPTGVDSRVRSTADLFFNQPGIKLVALYGPEHGIRGNAQAGEYVPFYTDDKYGVPVFSLYGQSSKPAPGMFRNIDEYMRSFDTKHDGKTPERRMVEDVDVLVFDIQDVGTRVYTYVATMAYAMQAAAEQGIKFIVLDRPNPVTGTIMEGPVLDFPAYSSFIGLYPVPLRHGMTVGELALLFNERYLKKKADLTVIPMEGWQRSMWYERTVLPWVIPSPNMPTPETAVVYPGFVALEGTNLSEGRGTTKPFELFGAPWVDGYVLARELNAVGLPGVTFREVWFTPVFSKFSGELCGGCQVHVTDRSTFRPVAAFLHVIQTVRRLYPGRFEFHDEYFDRVMGTDQVRKMLGSGATVEDILKAFGPGLEEFAKTREKYLLYR